jgi:thioester reductase-like protein
VAERLVAAARERGLAAAIYRPGRIVGHSTTGIWNTDDFACRAVRGSIELGVVPDLDPLDSMSPVDFVAKAIVHLSRQPRAFEPGAFHVVNPEFYLWRRLFDYMRRRGYALEDISYREWRRRLGEASENALKPLLPLFSVPPEHGSDGSGQRWSVLPAPNCSRASDGLGGAVVCPPLDDALWDRYFEFFRRTGYIQPAPSSAGSAI